MSIYRLYIKRMIDLILSFALMMMLFPLILLIFISQIFVYKLDVFYLQQRNGLREQVFTLFKFRTMKDTHDLSGLLLPDPCRVTTLGKLLRFFSLDELPNLVNVLLGHMSLVGPRPLPVHYLSKMDSSQKSRFNVRPGLTGLAQVSGRNDLNWSRKMELDLVYVKKMSFFLDLKIIFRTLPVLFASSEVKEIEKISFDNYVPNFNNKE